MIQVEGLTKRYGSPCIDHLTFHADKGEIVGFLVPTARANHHHANPHRLYAGVGGQSNCGGLRCVHRFARSAQAYRLLPETVPLYMEMSVWQYLDFMGELRQLPNRDDRIEEAMASVHMTDRADSLIGNLSKGMRQRVGLAQALLHKPEVLILDEPTIGLDPAQVKDVRELIREIGSERTVMLSTHILSEAQAICNRVLIINKGKILAEDTPDRLRARLSGGDRVGVKVMGDGAGLTEALNKVPGVTAVHAIKDGEYEIDAAPGGNIRPEIAKAVVNGGWSLIELKAMGMSLEDIYLQLVREEAEEEEAQNA